VRLHCVILGGARSGYHLAQSLKVLDHLAAAGPVDAFHHHVDGTTFVDREDEFSMFHRQLPPGSRNHAYRAVFRGLNGSQAVLMLLDLAFDQDQTVILPHFLVKSAISHNRPPVVSNHDQFSAAVALKTNPLRANIGEKKSRPIPCLISAVESGGLNTHLTQSFHQDFQIGDAFQCDLYPH
jgi:hypothetical protein